MVINKIERTSLIMVYIIVHIAVIFGFRHGDSWKMFPLSWNHQFVVLLLLMMSVSCVMPLLNSPTARQGLLWLRLFVTGILAVPTASHPESFGLIYMILIFDGFFYCSGFIAYLPGILCIIYSATLPYLRLSLWFKPVNPIDRNALIYTLVGSGLIFVISFFFTHERKLRHSSFNKFQMIQSSNQYLAETNIKLQNMATEMESAITLHERNRIAREIHDTVAYTLTNLLSLLNAYRERLQFSSQEIPEELNQARALVRDGLGDLRAVLHGLRSKEEEIYDGLGIVKPLVTVFSRATGIKVILEYSDVPQFPGKAIEVVLYRVVQEGLTNALRHGAATEIFIYFHSFKQGIELSIRDNGKGTDTFSGGFGLLGIEERVEALNGLVNITSQVGEGFTLRAWIPIRNCEVL